MIGMMVPSVFANHLKYDEYGNLDLTQQNLSGANLKGADLVGKKLLDVNLSDAILTGADLRYANLWNADLSGAFLTGANLKGADLQDANLSGAHITGTDFTNANLSGANLTDVNFKNSITVGTIFGDSVISMIEKNRAAEVRAAENRAAEVRAAENRAAAEAASRDYSSSEYKTAGELITADLAKMKAEDIGFDCASNREWSLENGYDCSSTRKSYEGNELPKVNLSHSLNGKWDDTVPKWAPERNSDDHQTLEKVSPEEAKQRMDEMFEGNNLPMAGSSEELKDPIPTEKEMFDNRMLAEATTPKPESVKPWWCFWC
jgi:uncharacterized protein YjbI with pentapeptide repeats